MLWSKYSPLPSLNVLVGIVVSEAVCSFCTDCLISSVVSTVQLEATREDGTKPKRQVDQYLNKSIMTPCLRLGFGRFGYPPISDTPGSPRIATMSQTNSVDEDGKKKRGL